MKRYPHPVYVVEQFTRTPKCDEGKDCNPAENPSHHIKLDLSPEARNTINTASEFLQEAHDGAMMCEYTVETRGTSWEGMKRWHRKTEPNCSYCRAITETAALLAAAKEK